MYIRKYTLLVIALIVASLILGVVAYQAFHTKYNLMDMEEANGNYRFTAIEEDRIEIYKDGKWEDFKVKGVELSSFTPGHSRYKTKIKKKEVVRWLEEISALNANLIKITGIQAPSFYNAIYDYNKSAEKPIYTIHEVMLDENEFLKNHDLYEKKLVKNFKKDIKNTIDIIHGRAFLLRTKRNYSGLYLKDISKYNLGYILGTNTSPEAVTLSNLKHSDKDNYHGEYISLEKGSSFEALVAKMLDYASSYEIKKYRQISLFSYLTTIETDPIEYKYESKMTKDASLNMDLISSGELENLFVAYRYHPNSADFLDYEYENLAEEDIYIGLDVTPKSGSDYWAKKEASFDLPVDFIIHLAGYEPPLLS